MFDELKEVSTLKKITVVWWIKRSKYSKKNNSFQEQLKKTFEEFEDCKQRGM